MDLAGVEVDLAGVAGEEDVGTEEDEEDKARGVVHALGLAAAEAEGEGEIVRLERADEGSRHSCTCFKGMFWYDPLLIQ